MNGRMALLLTFCLTGMVSGQQTQNGFNNFSAENSANTARSVMEDASTQTSNPVPDNQVGAMGLPLSDKYIQHFLANGRIEADIAPRQYVNEIVFFYAGNDTKNITEKLVPVSKTNEILRFEIDDYDLQQIKQKGLKYSFDQFELGRYKQVVVDYRQPGSASQSNSASNTGFGNGNDSGSTYNQSAQMGNTNRLSSNFSPTGANNQNSGQTNGYDPNFMGPFPGPVQRSTAQRTSRQNWSPTPNTGNQVADNFTGHDHDHDHDHSGNNFSGNENGFGGSQATTGGSNSISDWRRQQELQDLQNQRELAAERELQAKRNLQNQLDLRRQRDLLAERQRNVDLDAQAQSYQPRRHYNDLNNYDPNNYDPNNYDPNTYDPNASSAGNGNLTVAQRQQKILDQRKALALQEQNELYEQELDEIEDANWLKKQALEDQKRQTESLRQQILSGRTQRERNDYAGGQSDQRIAMLTGSEYGDQIVNGYNPPPQRTEYQNGNRPPSPSVRSYVGAIPGPQSGAVDHGDHQHIADNNPNYSGNSLDPTTRKNTFNQSGVLGNMNSQPNRTEGLLYFMLLCSLGMNVYLGWISRGFYFRYNELADELRETFTGTM